MADNSLEGVEYHKLYSFGENKKSGTRTGLNPTSSTSTISIKELLMDVNSIRNYRNTLPLDVLYRLNGYDYSTKSSPTDIEGLKYSISRQNINNLAQQEIDAYNKAIKSGDMETAQQIVNKAAKNAGYSSNSDYQGTSAFNGTAPSNQGWYETIDEAIEAWNNDEFEGPATLGMYKKHGIDINNLDFFLNNNRAYRNGNINQNIENFFKIHYLKMLKKTTIVIGNSDL